MIGCSIWQAAALGDVTRVRARLSCDSMLIDARDPQGNTALHLAAGGSGGQGEQVKVVRLLLRAGADNTLENALGQTAAQVARDGGAASLAEFIEGQRYWHMENCAVFRGTREQWGGLSNMAAGFPIRVGEARPRTSEHLYQACKFPANPEVQELILGTPSPLVAKHKAKRHQGLQRPDWLAVQAKVMWWCLQMKLSQNPVTFGRLLHSTGDLEIVEESHRDMYWAAVRMPDGRLRGCNRLGRQLMELRKIYREGRWSQVQPPDIPGLVVLGHDISVGI